MKVLPSILKRTRKRRPARPSSGILRRLVYFVLCCAVGFEVLVLTLFAVAPEALGIPVTVTNINVPVQVSNIMSPVDVSPSQWRNIQDILNELQTHTDRWNTALTSSGGPWLAPEFQAITADAATKIEGLPYHEANVSDKMKDAMPGYEPWEDYYQEYGLSAEGTLLTLQSSMDNLYAHYEDATRVEADRMQKILDEAQNAEGLLQIGQVNTQAMVEVSRQLQALRELQATQTNLYAVTESHKVGSEARNLATSNKARCDMGVEIAGGGVVDTGILTSLGGLLGIDINPCD